MQKLSEKLTGVEVIYVGEKSVVIPLELWTEILTRTASYEREIEGEKDMQRRMGIESTLLRRAIEDALIHRDGERAILLEALKIKR